VRTPAVPAVRAFPVSVKGVAVRDGQLLLENERAEWELPVGKLGEHKQVGLFTPIEVPGLPIPRVQGLDRRLVRPAGWRRRGVVGTGRLTPMTARSLGRG
jgi:hypothetical protein